MEAPPPPSPKPQKPLSQRLMARTADILAIALVLTIALTMGREVLTWWRTEPPKLSPAPPAVAGWGENGSPVDLEFGELPFTMTRQEFSGDREAVQTLLQDRCQAGAESSGDLPYPPDANEQATIAKVLSQKAVVEKKGEWKVVRFQDSFELTVGLRHFSPGDRWRIVAWGMAIPAGEGKWTVHLMAAGGTAAKVAGLPPVPVPPGSRRLLSMREPRGGALLGFLGPGPGQPWSRFYDRWFQEQGWTTDGWTASPTALTARFAPREGPGLADVQLLQDGDQWRGIVSLLAQ